MSIVHPVTINPQQQAGCRTIIVVGPLYKAHCYPHHHHYHVVPCGTAACCLPSAAHRNTDDWLLEWSHTECWSLFYDIPQPGLLILNQWGYQIQQYFRLIRVYMDTSDQQNGNVLTRDHETGRVTIQYSTLLTSNGNPYSVLDSVRQGVHCMNEIIHLL